MPTQDDDLRELFQQGRSLDREQAPAFAEVWQGAEREIRGRQRAGWALAAAAVLALGAGWLWFQRGEPAVAPESADIVATNPQPDLPGPDDAPTESAALAEFASWEPATFDSPSDFLLEDDGVLGGGLPSSTFDEPVLDLDDLTMEL